MTTTRHVAQVTHPTDYIKGAVTLQVHENTDGVYFVSGPGLGCSRDYPGKTRHEAIREFLAEHGARATRIDAEPGDDDERVGAACVSCGYVFTAADVDEDPGSIHRHADGYICDACDEGQRTDHLEREENARIGYYDRHGN